MNKNIVIIITVAVIALLGIWWYISAEQAASDKMMMEEKILSDKALAEKDVMMKKEEALKAGEAMMKKDEGVMMKSITVTMKEQSGSKQIGIATISDVDGKAKVTVRVATGMQGIPQPAHIHVGACPTPGAVVHPLNAVVNGVSETMLAISTTELMNKLPLVINVHKSADDAKTYVSCGDIVGDAMVKQEETMMKKDEGVMIKQ